jgi:hypothetical protein
MGHRDFKTTLIYADYAPSAQERELVERAFGRVSNKVTEERDTREGTDSAAAASET